MAEIKFNTRFQQKYGTHAEWVAADPTPKKGELCVVVVPAETGAVVQEPTILFKVGDGAKKYSELSFAGALAADVYDWAKAKDKPVYSATEITGIGDYIAEYVDETLGISVDTDTQYRITKVDDYTYKLQSKAKGEADTAFADVSTIVIPKYDDTGVTNRISALETLVGSTAVATQISNAIAALDLANTYEAKGTAATEAGKVQTALDEYKTSNDEAISKLETKTDAAQKLTDAKAYTDEKISELLDGADDTTLDSISELATAIKENDSAIDALNDIAGSKASQADLNTAVGRIDTLETEVAKKANDADLATIAKTGNVSDLIQNDGDVIVFNCGGPAIGTDSEYTD